MAKALASLTMKLNKLCVERCGCRRSSGTAIKTVLYILQTCAFNPEAAETGSQWALQVSTHPKTKGRSS